MKKIRDWWYYLGDAAQNYILIALTVAIMLFFTPIWVKVAAYGFGYTVYFLTWCWALMGMDLR